MKDAAFTVDCVIIFLPLAGAFLYFAVFLNDWKRKTLIHVNSFGHKYIFFFPEMLTTSLLTLLEKDTAPKLGGRCSVISWARLNLLASSQGLQDHCPMATEFFSMRYLYKVWQYMFFFHAFWNNLWRLLMSHSTSLDIAPTAATFLLAWITHLVRLWALCKLLMKLFKSFNSFMTRM